jgi:hypothetical protein
MGRGRKEKGSEAKWGEKKEKIGKDIRMKTTSKAAERRGDSVDMV